MKTRRSNIILLYDGVDISTDISPFLLSFTFQDNASGKADDLQVTLQDVKGLWRGDWYPKKGSKLSASIMQENWEKEGKVETLPCGVFQIDSIKPSGPPDIANIKGVSVPITSSLRSEKKTKAWESVSLTQIGSEIAAKAGLKFMFEADEDPRYDRIDQCQQSDLAFLQKIAIDAGLSLKVINEQIVIFDEEKYESKGTVRKIKRFEADVLGYDFETESKDTYSEAEVSYQDAETGEKVTASYKPSNAPQVGQKLKINERSSYADAPKEPASVKSEKAIKKAKKKLREKNKREFTAKLTLVGDVRLVSGITVDIEGWGVFDGKYIIETATHKIDGSGYTVELEIRKVLEGY